jgi:serine/threonine protein kinase
MIGRTVGTYRIVERIGEGGMGTVFRAVDGMLEREVALKAVRPDLASDPQMVERFRVEARAAARIQHPAIATIYSFFQDGDELFLAMEYVAGESLAQLLRREGALAWPRAVALFRSALEGIAYVHRLGIVHRDLKPDNLMLTSGGAVKVMDFGIARVAGNTRLTRTGLLLGTLRYMPPEQINGEETDHRSDIYALGIVLYQLLTGRVPFSADNDYALLRAQLQDPPQPPASLVPEIPDWLDQAVLRALAKDPAQRFQSAEEFLAALAPALAFAPEAVTRPRISPLSAGAGAGIATPTLPTVKKASAETLASPVTATRAPASGTYGDLLPPSRRFPRWALLALPLGLLAVAGLSLWLLLGRAPAPVPDLASAPPPVTTTSTAPDPAFPETKPEPEPSSPSAAVAPPTTAASAAKKPLKPPVPVRETPSVPPPAAADAQPTVQSVVVEPPPPAVPESTQGPAPSDEVMADNLPQNLPQLAASLEDAVSRLSDTCERFLEEKEDGGTELGPADEQLQQEIAGLAEHTARIRRRISENVFSRTRDRLRRLDVAARRAETERQLAALRAAADRVDRRIAEVHPNAELKQAWAEVRQIGRRMGQRLGGR